MHVKATHSSKRGGKQAGQGGREQGAAVARRLGKVYPQALCSLDFASPFQLLIATILSAQCTDKRVNVVTAVLFGRCKSVADYAAIPQEELEALIHSTGFFRNKARNIRAMAEALLARHGGEVPRTLDALAALPGVGRKTANVVLGNAFGLNEGVVVDTHVSRLSQRLGLTKHSDPVRIERDLMAAIPSERWTDFSHWLIFHGRPRCTARKPACDSCEIEDICPSAPKKKSSSRRPVK